MKNAKILVVLGVFLVTACVATCFFFAMVYSPEYIYRCLAWQVLRLEEPRPAHLIESGSTPYQFTVGSLEEEKKARALLSEAFRTTDLETFLASEGTSAFLVAQDDKLLYEHYFNGYERTSLLESYSATKSVVSALVGIAIADGKIQSIDDPMTEYIPELSYRDARWAKIKIRDLLTMASGLRFDDYFFFTSDGSLTGNYPDLRYALIRFPVIRDEPGLDFFYNDYNPLLLGLVLERATGTSVSDFLETRIWQPIGMEYGGSWVLDSQQSGFEKMAGGLNGRAVDFAKLGRLYLARGAWNGQRILPESWVAESTQGTAPDLESSSLMDSPDAKSGPNYGYMWWILPRENGPSDYYAMGKYGQMIYISPATNLIIVRFGDAGGDEADFAKWYQPAYRFAGSFGQAF